MNKSTVKLDPLTIHNDDLTPTEPGRFGNIYYNWDEAKTNQRESNERQFRIAANREAK